MVFSVCGEKQLEPLLPLLLPQKVAGWVTQAEGKRSVRRASSVTVLFFLFFSCGCTAIFALPGQLL